MRELFLWNNLLSTAELIFYFVRRLITGDAIKAQGERCPLLVDSRLDWGGEVLVLGTTWEGKIEAT